jgi:hypothetical protein
MKKLQDQCTCSVNQGLFFMAEAKEGKNGKGEATAISNNSNYEAKNRGKCRKEDQGRPNIVSGTLHKIQG